jgi:hypothetical protein
MYDSTTIATIPASAPMVAAYANGRYQNYEQARVRFPRIPVVSIAVNTSGFAHVLDIEQGDATPEQFHGWATAVANRGVRRPTAYCSRSTATAVLRSAPPGVVTDLWLADWSGTAHPLSLPRANVVAVQFAAPGHGSPGHYDVSAVFDDSWHAS